jgi:phosphatidylethanolamine/phosphatidyl-N-methylethanolamine N-methyltransferase
MSLPRRGFQLRGAGISSHTIRQTYDRFSSLYDFFLKPYLEFGREAAITKLAPEVGERVLEIGVGTGLSFEYYPPDVEVVGFDYSEGMLRQSQIKLKDNNFCDMHLLQMDAQHMAFADNSFDKVFAAYVMTVIPDTRQALREIIRIAKPGARVVFINHLRSNNSLLSILEDVFHPIFSRIGLFTLDRDLIGMLHECGIENLEIEPTSIFRLHFVLSFTVPQSK